MSEREPETQVIAGLLARGYSEHVTLHGPDDSSADYVGRIVTIKRGGIEYTATVTSEELTGQGDPFAQRAQCRAWGEAEDAAALIRNGDIHTARESLASALRYLDQMEKRS